MGTPPRPRSVKTTKNFHLYKMKKVTLAKCSNELVHLIMARLTSILVRKSKDTDTLLRATSKTRLCLNKNWEHGLSLSRS